MLTNKPCKHTKRPKSTHMMLSALFLEALVKTCLTISNIIRAFNSLRLWNMAHDLPQMVQTFSIMIVLFWNMSFDDYLYQFSSLSVCQCMCLSRCTVVTTTCTPGSWLPSKRRQSCRRMNQACVHQTWGVPPPLTKHTKTLATGTGPHPVYPLSCPSHTSLPAALCLLQEEEVSLVSFLR